MNAPGRAGPPILPAPVIRVRGLEEARLAAAAAAGLGKAFCLASQEAASAYAGAGWFARMAATVAAEYPGTVALAILDCGDRAGDVMAGLAEPVTAMRYDGPPAVASKLRAMAGEAGIRMVAELGPCLDLSRQADPVAACRAWLDEAPRVPGSATPAPDTGVMTDEPYMGDFPGCQLYLVTPPAIDLEPFADALQRALDGGAVAALQLRLKGSDDDSVRRAAARLLPLCRGHDVVFLLNDRPDLAVEMGADGVHLGQDDTPAREARRMMGADAVIGVTCHNSRDLAFQAAEDGADYVAFGAFFPTRTKEAKTRAEPWLIAWWHEVATVPQVAIGGITAANCAPLVAAGVDFLAVSGGVWNHSEGPTRAVQAFHTVIARTPVDPSVAREGAS